MAATFRCAAHGRPTLAWQAPRPLTSGCRICSCRSPRTAGGSASAGDARSSRAACRWPSSRSSSSRRRCGARAAPAARPPGSLPRSLPGSSAASRSASAASRAPGAAPLAAAASTLPAAACSPRALAVRLPAAAAGGCGGGCEVRRHLCSSGGLAQRAGCWARVRPATAVSTSPAAPAPLPASPRLGLSGLGQQW
jgi:hypothetical protein